MKDLRYLSENKLTAILNNMLALHKEESALPNKHNKNALLYLENIIKISENAIYNFIEQTTPQPQKSIQFSMTIKTPAGPEDLTKPSGKLQPSGPRLNNK